MTIPARTFLTVNFGTPSSLADAQARVDEVLTRALASGYIPETIQTLTGLAPIYGDLPPDVLGLTGTSPDNQDWAGVTQVAVVLKFSTVATADADSYAEAVARMAAPAPSLRGGTMLTIDIGGAPRDVLALLFTNGSTPSSQLADDVANVSDLSLIDDTAQPDGASFFVETKLQPFTLDKTSTQTVNGITVVATLSGVGRWLRNLVPAPHWTAQLTWYQDSALGDDEASGQLGFPVKTMLEICCRLRQLNPTTYTINCLDPVNATVATDFFRFDGEGGVVGAGGTATVVTNGVRTAVYSAAFTATSPTVTATSIQASVTDAAAPWAANMGRHIVMTSGAALGATAVILADLGAGVARVSEFVFEATGVLSAFPSPADTFDIVTESAFLAPVPGRAAPTGFNLEFSKVQFGANLGSFDNVVTFRGTRHTATIPAGVPVLLGGSLLAFNGCSFTFGVLTNAIQVVNGVVELIGGGAINARFQYQLFGQFRLQNFTSQAGAFRTSPAGNIAAGGFLLLAAGQRFGLFDVPVGEGAAITLQRGSQAVIAGSLYGSSAAAVVGVSVLNGGKMMIASPAVPTLTGATADLRLDGAATAYQALELHSGALAAAVVVPLATWAQWSAAVVLNVSGFNRNAVSHKTLSSITSL